MNVLYISYDGMTDPLGQSQVLPYLIGLSKQGYRFTLISCEKPERYQSGRAVIEAICQLHQIYWQPLPYTKSPPIFSTIKDVRSIQKLAFKLNKVKSFKLIHCRGYISALVGKKLKAELGVKFLFDMRGLWANEKVDAGAWNLNNPIFKMVYNYFKKQEKLFFEQADYSICLTEAGKKEIHSWSHIQNNPVPIQVIPCCADLDHFDRAKVSEDDLNQLRDQLKIKPGEVVISYLGGIGTWYMLDEMLDFFLVFKEAVPRAKFLFITGDEHDSIVNKALQKGIAREELVLKKASRQEVPLCLALSNYALFFIRPTYSKLASSPTKQGEIMAMGIPLVCNSGVGDTDGIVTNYQSGIVNQVFALEGYQESIKKLLSTPFSPAHLRAGALNYFNLAEGVARYAWVYNQIMG